MESKTYLRLFSVWLLLLSLQSLTADASNSTAPPEDKPFLSSDAFIGLAIGVGAVGGTLILCCLLWRCFCSDADK